MDINCKILQNKNKCCSCKNNLLREGCCFETCQAQLIIFDLIIIVVYLPSYEVYTRTFVMAIFAVSVCYCMECFSRIYVFLSMNGIL